MLKKIGATESDVLSEKSQNKKNSVTGCVPRVSETPAKAPKPLQRLPNPSIPINMPPLPFNKATVSGLATACLARLYICIADGLERPAFKKKIKKKSKKKERLQALA